ncbi:MAG: peroxiredoxin family protein [Bacillota bacterium]
MKKIIIAALLLVMFGYSLYEFIDPFSEEAESEDFNVVEDEGTLEENDETNEQTDSGPEVGTSVGNLAPDFMLSSTTGETVSLSDYRGKRVMVNFWGTWCPPCRAEMPDMEKFYQENDVEILAVNLTPTESNVSDVTDFIDEFGLSFQVLLDEELAVSSQYGIQPVPTSFMVDSNGIVQYVALGAVNYEQMVQALNTME